MNSGNICFGFNMNKCEKALCLKMYSDTFVNHLVIFSNVLWAKMIELKSFLLAVLNQMKKIEPKIHWDISKNYFHATFSDNKNPFELCSCEDISNWEYFKFPNTKFVTFPEWISIQGVYLNQELWLSRKYTFAFIFDRWVAQLVNPKKKKLATKTTLFPRANFVQSIIIINVWYIQSVQSCLIYFPVFFFLSQNIIGKNTTFMCSFARLQ